MIEAVGAIVTISDWLPLPLPTKQRNEKEKRIDLSCIYEVLEDCAFETWA